MAARVTKAIDPLAVPESNQTSYPALFREANQRRWNRRVGDQFGLENFGVNITRIIPGGQSSSRHWHSRQDEFVYVMAGDVVLETNAGEQPLSPGMCVGFPAGAENGHRFVNRGAGDVLLLVVGDRTSNDEVTYPDLDLHGRMDANGRYRFTRKNGTPLE